MKKDQRLSIVFVLVTCVAALILLMIPTGFEQEENNRDVERVRARVIEVDDTNVFITGMMTLGDQELTLEVMEGSSRGEILKCRNGLVGKLEKDKFFADGDTAFITIKYSEDKEEILFVNVVDHYRLDVELILAAGFGLGLILLCGWTGAKALLSFVISVLAIWKVLLPAVLKGYSPILITMAVLVALTFVITFLVAGFSQKGLCAFSGSALGIAATCGLTILFGNKFMVDASVMPFAESLLYSGFAHINMRDLLYSAVFLASSGAVMDIAMDIASALDEIKEKRPDIGMWELFRSGMTVSRSVVGTMTTTLLLAYTGSYMTTMMTFIAKGVAVLNVLNIRYVASEILTTLVGSFGLILVAPFTSAACAYIYSKRPKESSPSRMDEERIAGQ